VWSQEQTPATAAGRVGEAVVGVPTNNHHDPRWWWGQFNSALCGAPGQRQSWEKDGISPNPGVAQHTGEVKML